MNIVEIPLNKIDVGERLRPIDQDYVALLAASMREQGQRTPAEVRKGRGERYRLIAGAHRYAARELAGFETIFAVVLQANDLQAKLLEIDENLIRRELSVLDRATFLAERKSVYEALHPEARRGGDRRSDQTVTRDSLIEGFSAATAERLGISWRTVMRSVARHERIPAALRARLNDTWIADSGSQLDALAKLSPALQLQVADFIVDDLSVRSVAEIVRRLTNAPAAAPATDYDRFLSLWRKADATTRARIRAFMARPDTDARDAA